MPGDHVVRRHFLMMMMMVVVNVDSEVNPKSSYLSVAVHSPIV